MYRPSGRDVLRGAVIGWIGLLVMVAILQMMKHQAARPVHPRAADWGIPQKGP